MAITPRAVGAWAYAASGSVTPTLPTHATGDMLLVRVAYKSSAIATCLASTATSGWVKTGEFHDGTVNSGTGLGSVAVSVFWKIAASASETNPTIDFSQTVTQVGHSAVSWQKGGTDPAWLDPVGAGGPHTGGTSFSAIIGSHVEVKTGDMVVVFMASRDDTAFTVPTFTQTGVTYAAVTEYPATAGLDGSGADGSYDACYRAATSGTSSAAAVVTATLAVTETGSAWQTRLRLGGLPTFTADAFINIVVGTTFTADAVIRREITPTFTAEAAKSILGMASLLADAVVKREITPSVSANAVVKATQSRTAAADAVVSRSQSATFTGNAVLRTAASAAFTANAVQLKTTTAGFNADAVLRTGRLDGYTAAAALLSPRASSFNADASIFVLGAGASAFDADAILHREQTASLGADAFITATRSDDFTADAALFASRSATFTADAISAIFIVHADTFSADAWMALLHFDSIVVTMTAPVIAGTMTTEATRRSASFSANAVIEE